MNSTPRLLLLALALVGDGITKTTEVPSSTPKFLPTALPSSTSGSSTTQASLVPTIPTDQVSTSSESITVASTSSTSVPTVEGESTTVKVAETGAPVLKDDSTTSTVTPKKVAPFGTWSSPITSDVVFRDRNNIIEPPRVDSVTGNVFWVEEVAEEGGHGVLFQYDPNTAEIARWTGPKVNVRTRVHEYGGGSFIAFDGRVFYSEATDNQIYQQVGPNGVPEKITNSPNKRYADASYSPKTNKLYYVCEDHTPVTNGTGKEAKNSIVVIDLNADYLETELVGHADFFAAPRVTEDGESIVWMQWNHPNMPWDKTEVYVAKIDQNNEVAYEKYLQNDNMMMPSFNQHRELLYVHETTGWWNLYIIDRKGAERNLTPENLEAGWPLWQLGTQSYASNPAIGTHEVAVIAGKELRIVDTLTGESRTLDTGYTSYTKGIAYSIDGKKVYAIAADKKRFRRMVEIDVATGVAKSLRNDTQTPVPDGFISSPVLVNFRTTDDMFAYGHYYAPVNENYEAPAGTAPPLLVRCHGGPTASASTTLNLEYQFFTSRGIAILDVDYRGSTGYGRFYRDLMRHKWGVYDLDDMLAGTRKMVADGLADPNLLFADGASAGGYTTLSALVHSDMFAAGASLYGISNMTTLLEDTHKFESQYPFYLIGDYPAEKETYFNRSPINFRDNITSPVIFFHGTEDAVVPINQAQSFYNIIKNKGIPTALVVYEGEHHGFTRLENKIDYLEKELTFFSKIGKFPLSDINRNIVIENF